MAACFAGLVLSGSGPMIQAAPAREDAPHDRDRFEGFVAQARAEGDTERLARYLSQLAEAHIEQGEYLTANRIAGEALAVARREGHATEETNALGILGDSRFYLCEYADALEDYRAERDRARELGLRTQEANAIKSTGVIHRYLGRYEESLEELETARRIYAELDQGENEASSLMELGSTYLALGEGQRALYVNEEAKEIVERNGDPSHLQHVLIRLGVLYLGAGLPEEAIEPAERAAEIAEKVGLPVQRIWALSVLSRALARIGRVDEALSLQDRVLEIGRQVETDGHLEARYADLGVILLESDPARAAGYLDQALAMSRASGGTEPWPLLVQRARASRKLGELDRAVDLYTRSIEQVESIRSTIVSKRFRTTYMEEHASVYQELIEVLFERNERSGRHEDLERAFNVLERAKARVLVETVAEATADARLDLDRVLDPDLHARENVLRARNVQLENRLSEEQPASAARRSLTRERDQNEDEYQSLIEDVRLRNPRYAAMRYPDPLISGQASALMDRRTALLAFAMTREALLVFIVTSEGVDGLRLRVSPAVVEERVRNYLDLISGAGGGGWAEVSRRLDADLIDPIRARLAARIDRLIVAPDGILHFLPFETLRDEEGFLLERFSIAYTPSATALAQLRLGRLGSSDGPGSELVIFADPEVSTVVSDLSGHVSARARERALFEEEGIAVAPIPSSAAEARAIQRLVGGLSEVYVGAEATEKRVKTERLDRFRVIHFATHGLVSLDRPSRSALLLTADRDQTEDGLLQAREILNLRLESDLVVLSACQTARGRVATGEGVQGLAQAFLYAGSRSVLATLWNVNDDRAAWLMQRFYRGLADGLTGADALRAAKLAMLADRSSAAPRFWAPFILIGAGHEPVGITRPAWWRRQEAWIASGAALLLAFGCLLLVGGRRRVSG